MAITYTDSLGVVLDTGCGSQPTARASTEVEQHATGEVDTGSKLTLTQLVVSHRPHRESGSPR